MKKLLTFLCIIVLIIPCIYVTAASKSKVALKNGNNIINISSSKNYSTIKVARLLKGYKSSKMTISLTLDGPKIVKINNKKSTIKPLKNGSTKVQIIVKDKKSKKELFSTKLTINIGKENFITPSPTPRISAGPKPTSTPMPSPALPTPKPITGNGLEWSYEYNYDTNGNITCHTREYYNGNLITHYFYVNNIQVDEYSEGLGGEFTHKAYFDAEGRKIQIDYYSSAMYMTFWHTNNSPHDFNVGSFIYDLLFIPYNEYVNNYTIKYSYDQYGYMSKATLLYNNIAYMEASFTTDYSTGNCVQCIWSCENRQRIYYSSYLDWEEIEFNVNPTPTQGPSITSTPIPTSTPTPIPTPTNIPTTPTPINVVVPITPTPTIKPTSTPTPTNKPVTPTPTVKPTNTIPKETPIRDGKAWLNDEYWQYILKNIPFDESSYWQKIVAKNDGNEGIEYLIEQFYKEHGREWEAG